MKRDHATHITSTSSIARKSQLDNLHLKKFVNFADGYEMPTLKACNIIPTSLVSFNAALTAKDHNQCVHFFIDDYQFERIWNLPDRYVECLRQFQCVIAPDFSQYTDMPYPQRMWNNYRGKFIGAWLQSQGVTVIPNVTWSLPDSYDYCFDGIPQQSVIAINSTGAARYGLTRFLWLKGYREALSRLRPLAIIRYGTMIPGEDTSVSIYFNNERVLNLRSYGR
jgi:hypothetical protein